MADTKISAMTDGVPAQDGDLIAAAREISPGVYGNVSLTAASVAARAAGVPSDFQPAIVAGAAYTWPTQAMGDDNPSSDVLMTVPFWCSHTVTWTKIGTRVTFGEAGAKVRLGVYAADASNRPGDLLIDAGEIDGSTDGDKELDISLTIPANTLVYLASLCSVVVGDFAAGTVGPFSDGRENAIIGASPDEMINSISFARAQAYGPLPATVGPGDGNSGRYPLPWLRTGV